MEENRMTNYAEKSELIIMNFSDANMGSRLISMGILPGSLVTITRVAPLRGGYCLRTDTGQKIALRYAEAHNIIVQ